MTKRFFYPPLDAFRKTAAILFRDDFTTDDDAPVTSPRTSEPGPGTITFDQTDGTFAITGSALAFTAQTTPTWGDQGFWSGAQTRAAGLALFNQINLSTWEECGIGWHTLQADADPDNMQHALQVHTTDGRLNNHNAIQLITGLSTSTNYTLAQVLRSTGAFQLLKSGSTWTLLWVDATGSTAALYPVFANLDGAGTIDNLIVAQLAAGWATDNGIATSSSASPAEGYTFAHEADCLLDFTVTTMPSTPNMNVLFRYQDSDNYWIIRVHPDGTLHLLERVAASATNRATTAAGAVSNGDRILVFADDETITGYINNTQAWSYSSAATFKTETSGRINSVGTAGVINNLIAWPRTISGANLNQLNKYS